MKAYLVTLGQLSAVHAGVQGAHAMHELCVRHHHTNWLPTGKIFEAWSTEHKTLVLLNGGPLPKLLELGSLLHTINGIVESIPVGEFCEDESLGNLLTAIAFILPERLEGWEAIKGIEEDPSLSEEQKVCYYKPCMTLEEYRLVKLVRSLRLVR